MNEGRERFSNLPNVTQVESGRTKIWIQEVWIPGPVALAAILPKDNGNQWPAYVVDANDDTNTADKIWPS